MKSTNSKSVIISIVSILIAICIIFAVSLSFFFGRDNIPSFNQSELTFSADESIEVTDDLIITKIGGYTGMYLEDGTDEIVSDVMMILLKNEGERDLQLARIKLAYSGFTAEFEASNIPAGRSVVLLERNRHSSVTEKHQSVSADAVAFFSDNMSLMPDVFTVKGGEGSIELTNISSAPVEGITYVYYKNSADDMLYGGITYRAKFTTVIKPGESASVLTNHFNADNSEVVQIVNVK